MSQYIGYVWLPEYERARKAASRKRQKKYQYDKKKIKEQYERKKEKDALILKENLEQAKVTQERNEAETRRKYKKYFDLVESDWFNSWYEREFGIKFRNVIGTSGNVDGTFIRWLLFDVIGHLKRREDERARKAAIVEDYLHSDLKGSAKRHAIMSFATPSWRNKEKIDAFYDKRDRLNEEFPEDAPFEVDHIIPIQGERVCGLHVEFNLRVIPASENRSKSNRFRPHDIEDYCWTERLTE